MLDFSNLAYDVKKEQVLFQLEKFRKHLDEINETLGSHGVVESHLDNLIDTLEAYYVFDPLLGKPRDLKKKAIMWLIGITVAIIVCYLLHRYREPITRNINNFFGGIAKAFGDQIRETVVQPILDDAEDRSEDLKDLVVPALKTIQDAVEVTKVGVDKFTTTAKELPQQLGDEVRTALAGLPGKLTGGAARSALSTITRGYVDDPVTAEKKQQTARLEEKNARERTAALQEEAERTRKKASEAQEEVEVARRKIDEAPPRRAQKVRRRVAALEAEAERARQIADEAARAAQVVAPPPAEAPQPPPPQPVVQPAPAPVAQPGPVPQPAAVQPPPATDQPAQPGFFYRWSGGRVTWFES